MLGAVLANLRHFTCFGTGSGFNQLPFVFANVVGNVDGGIFVTAVGVIVTAFVTTIRVIVTAFIVRAAFVRSFYAFTCRGVRRGGRVGGRGIATEKGAACGYRQSCRQRQAKNCQFFKYFHNILLFSLHLVWAIICYALKVR